MNVFFLQWCCATSEGTACLCPCCPSRCQQWTQRSRAVLTNQSLVDVWLNMVRAAARKLFTPTPVPLADDAEGADTSPFCFAREKSGCWWVGLGWGGVGGDVGGTQRACSPSPHSPSLSLTPRLPPSHLPFLLPRSPFILDLLFSAVATAAAVGVAARAQSSGWETQCN